MKPLIIEENKDRYNRTVYNIRKSKKSIWIFGSIEWNKRQKGWYFCDWGETTWSSQHMQEIFEFMRKLKNYD